LRELKRLGVTAEPVAPIPSRPDNIKDSVFPVADGVSAGVALCWEQVRYRTAKRLTRRVDLILAASDGRSAQRTSRARTLLPTALRSMRASRSGKHRVVCPVLSARR
jgi:hypothetical protein